MVEVKFVMLISVVLMGLPSVILTQGHVAVAIQTMIAPQVHRSAIQMHIASDAFHIRRIRFTASIQDVMKTSFAMEQEVGLYVWTSR